jgi:hypothetical protein
MLRPAAGAGSTRGHQGDVGARQPSRTVVSSRDCLHSVERARQIVGEKAERSSEWAFEISKLLNDKHLTVPD